MSSRIYWPIAVLLTTAWAHAQILPAATGVYPSGGAIPLNTKIVAYTPCCNDLPSMVVKSQDGVSVPGTTFARTDMIVFTPSQPLKPKTIYAATVSLKNFKDFVGQFTTGVDNTPPAPFQIASTYPAANQYEVLLTANFRVRMTTPVNPTTLSNAAFQYVDLKNNYPTSTNPYVAPANGVELVGTWYGNLPLGNYHFRYNDTTIQDIYGQKLANPSLDISFSTLPPPPAQNAHLLRSVPADLESGVPTNSAIYVEFDTEFALDTAAFDLSASNDPSAPIAIEAVQGKPAAFVVRPKLLLRPNSSYTLTATKLYDAFGRLYTLPALVHFNTTLLPEGRPVALLTQPAGILPLVNKLRWTFDRPLHPYLFPGFWRVPPSTSSASMAIPLRLSADGLTLEADIPSAGVYYFTGSIYDRVSSSNGNLSGYLGNNTVVTSVPDPNPPVLLATAPADQSLNAAPTSLISILTDKTLVPLLPTQISLTSNGVNFAVDRATNSGQLQSFRPHTPLIAGQSYQVTVTGLRDYSDHVLADKSWTFQVAADNLPPFHIADMSPVVNSLNLDPRASVTITFNRPPSLISILTSYLARVSTGSGTATGTWTITGNSAVFQPDVPLPSGHLTILLGDITDDGARPLDTPTAWTGWIANPATGFPAPRLIASSPANGQVGFRTVTLDFDQPLNPNSISNQSILFSLDPPYTYSAFSTYNTSYDAVLRRVTLTLNYDFGGSFRLSITPTLLSLYGTPAEPASMRFTLGSTSSSYSAGGSSGTSILNGIFPYGQQISPDSPLVIRFNAAYPHDMIEGALQIVVGSDIKTGRFEWTPDSLAVVFYPSTPWPISQHGYVYLSLVPWGSATAEVASFDTLPYTPPPAPSYQTSALSYIPADGWIEVEFAQDQPSGYLLGTRLYSGQGDVPSQNEVRSARRFRVRPLQPLPPGGYNLEARIQGLDKPLSVYAIFVSNVTPLSRDVEVGPASGMGSAPVNGIVWIRAHTFINPVTVKPLLTVGGVSHPFTLEFRDYGRLAVLRPSGLLHGNSTYSVVMTGLEDMAGRPLPDQSWTFNAAAGISAAEGSLISYSPHGAGAIDTIPRLNFDTPVVRIETGYGGGIPTIPAEFQTNTSAGIFTAEVHPSRDGLSMSYVPTAQWPIGSQVTLGGSGFDYMTWTGNAVRYSLPTFNVTDSATIAPTAAFVNPPKDSTGVPLNARLRIRFDQEILTDSLSNIRLELDGQPQQIRSNLDANTRILELLPNGLLPNCVYTIVLDGVRNGNGVARDVPERWSFQTGSEVWSGYPFAATKVVSENPLQVQWIFSRPIDSIDLFSKNFLFNFNSGLEPANLTLSPDSRIATINPVVPITSAAFGSIVSTYAVDTGPFSDWAGNQYSFSSGTLAIGDNKSIDNTPPRAVQFMPADGSVAGASTIVAVVFDKPVSGSVTALVSNRGRLLPATIQLPQQPSTVLMMTPFFDWLPGESYQIELSGLLDSSGNPAPSVRWSFSIRPDGTADATPLTVVSTTPKAGAVGVAPGDPIVVQFSRPVIPWGNSYLTAFGSNTSYYPPINTAFTGATVNVTPRVPLPGGSNIGLTLSARSSGGTVATAYVSFTTAAAIDTTPPQLELVSPAANSALPPGPNTFLLRFSKPVTIPGNAIRLSGAADFAQFQLARDDGRTFFFTATVPAGQSTTVLNLFNSIVDLSGNALVAQTIPYTVLPASQAGIPYLVSALPANGDLNVPANSTIALQFNVPMNEASMRVGMQVLDSGAPVLYQLTSENEGRLWRVTPASPWIANSTVRVTVTRPYSEAGLLFNNGDLNLTFQIATNATDQPPIVTGLLATPRQIDVRFSGPISDASPDRFILRTGQTRLPARVETVAECWVRITPDSPLDSAAAYVLMTGPGVEFPLALEQSPSVDSLPLYTVETLGPQKVQFRFDRPVHPFMASLLDLIDSAGNQVEARPLLSADGLTMVLELAKPLVRSSADLSVKYTLKRR